MSNTAMHYSNLSPREVYDLQSRGQLIDLVDVRTAGEYESLHAEGARSVPLGELTPQSATSGRRSAGDQPLYIICQSGGRSRTACQRLAAAGIKVVNVEGGTSAWKRAGLPVVRSAGGSGRFPSGIRMGAVGLALVMLVLGFTVHPGFLWAAGAVWLALLIINGGCPLGSCAIDPRGGSASEPPNRDAR
ncbi:MAG: rhodanese-like domain-containing protein [Tepidisphaeraceae bacterium]